MEGDDIFSDLPLTQKIFGKHVNKMTFLILDHQLLERTFLISNKSTGIIIIICIAQFIKCLHMLFFILKITL